MVDPNSELLDKIRQQFNSAPYPVNPLEELPKDDPDLLFKHNQVTPYYLRNQRVLDTHGTVILDAGCGTGYTSLVLAEANPGATIVGIDLSEESIHLARQRAQYHGRTNLEFHALSIEDIPKLGRDFDYINCDEVLYLLPDPIKGLQVMQSVLKPEGILRANLHSSLQRHPYYRSQKLFQLMGLLDANPGDLEIEIVAETMQALKDTVDLKARAWRPEFGENTPQGRSKILSNHLLLGDKGFTIAELFAALRAADLEFISMVNWRQWELLDLFKDPENLPVFWAMSLPDLSVEQQLQIFELLHPVGHRLLDFWCGHPDQAKPHLPVAEWSDLEWQRTTVQLHPQLQRSEIKDVLCQKVADYDLFEISHFISTPAQSPVLLKSTLAACLLPLWEGPQSVQVLSQRLLQISPVNPATLEPLSPHQAWEIITELLQSLEVFLYVLLELPSHPG